MDEISVVVPFKDFDGSLRGRDIEYVCVLQCGVVLIPLNALTFVLHTRVDAPLNLFT
jgi:hypothetical protein